ncbi:MAG: tetratricopeptide repeat protein [Flavobacteriaceae bacterium]|nr:tetratricopeptide repeat protein [Bacteroidia bacterium]NNK82679.1 tetratricopeptide repeat protein [Flavobacteriaceae bacterium]
MKKVVSIVSFLLTFVAFAQNNVIYQEGNALYNQGKYQEAITAYETIIDNGEHSAELYFNLGNAYYKLNSIAPSIYYYEKALQLNPKDKDIQNNLTFAKNMTIDAIEEVPSIGLNRFMKSFIKFFDFETWAILSVGFVFAFVVIFLMYYFSHSTGKKRFLFLSSIASLVFMVFCLFFAFQNFNLEKNDKPAIVFAKKSQVRTEPNLRSENAFFLHEGTKIQMLEIYNEDWVKIKIADGKTGWIVSEDIKPL